jgi:RNA polymerase sigma-70 factor, ECF subfamily
LDSIEIFLVKILRALSLSIGGTAMAITGEQLMGVLLRDRETLFSYCWSILRNDELAEEVFQEVCTLAVQKSQQIVDERHLAGWLRQAARRKAFELLRARAGAPQLLDDQMLDLLEADWHRWDSTPSAVLMDSLRDCMAALGEAASKLIELRYGQGLKSGQIARRLNRNVETVYVSLSRIHAKLARCIRSRLALSQ